MSYVCYYDIYISIYIYVYTIIVINYCVFPVLFCHSVDKNIYIYNLSLYTHIHLYKNIYIYIIYLYIHIYTLLSKHIYI